MTSKRRVVIVDDEPDICRYIASILEDGGFDTRTAENAADGEALIREDPPDLVCIDLMMPGRSGVQLFARLKGDEATKDIPLVMITGIKEKLNIDWADIVKSLRTRMPEGFVDKPIDPVRLMRVVQAVLGGEKDGIQFG